MAFLLKQMYETYFYLMEVADPRTNEYVLARTPFPMLTILFFWYNFVFKWGPEYMKDRKPFELKTIMMVYNGMQVLANIYMVYYLLISANTMNWRCSPVDYSDSYWGRKHHFLAYCYFLLKIADLLDTVFFVLRKKYTHVSFLHTYHHFMMVLVSWIAVTFIGGGHCYFVGLANCSVHSILYSYYLLTAYNSKYGKLIWLKKLITQAQLTQFVFLFIMCLGPIFTENCQFPKLPMLLLLPQNAFMITLFGDFYVKAYIINPRKKKALEEEAKREAIGSTKSS